MCFEIVHDSRLPTIGNPPRFVPRKLGGLRRIQWFKQVEMSYEFGEVDVVMDVEITIINSNTDYISGCLKCVRTCTMRESWFVSLGPDIICR